MILTLSGAAALSAIADTGSFEAAAERLGLTQSAVSQRVRQLEETLGATLVVRGRPCVLSTAGQRVQRYAEEVGLSQQRLLADLGVSGAERVRLRIAINADSLATWFFDALASEKRLLFDVVIADEGRAAEFLRRGEVVAALGRTGPTVAGCDQFDVGKLRYVACASPAFFSKWFSKGVNAASLSAAPCLRFGSDDYLQYDWARRLTGQTIAPPYHLFPSSQAFVDGCIAGMGWAMNPKQSVQHLIDSGRLTPLGKKAFHDVPLCWRWSRAAREGLAVLNASIRRRAKSFLLSPR